MGVLDKQDGLNDVVTFIESNESNVQRVYSDDVGVPTIGIGYALAINSGTSTNPNWVLRDVNDINTQFREAGIFGEGQGLTSNDLSILLAAVDALNGVPGAINPISEWAPQENSVSIHNNQGWSFSSPTVEENRKLLQQILPDYEQIVINRLGLGAGITREQADTLWESLSDENQIALLDMGFNAPSLIGL